MATRPEDVEPQLEDEGPDGRGTGGGDASGSGGAPLSLLNSGVQNKLLVGFHADDYIISEADLKMFLNDATLDECSSLSDAMNDVITNWVLSMKALKAHMKDIGKDTWSRPLPWSVAMTLVWVSS